MFLMRADPLRRQVGGGWALEINFFGAWNDNERSECTLGPQKVLKIVPKRIFFSVHAKASFRNSIQDHSWLSKQFFESCLEPGKTFQEGFRKNFSKLVSFFEPNIKFVFIFYLSQKGHPNFLKPTRAHTESTDVIFKTFKKTFISWHSLFKAEQRESKTR